MGLTVVGIRVAFAGEPVLRDVSLEVADGELVAVLGPSGAGKTTLLKAVSGILRQDSGTVEIDGATVDEVPAHRRGTAVVFQDLRLFPHLSVEDNVAFPLKMGGIRRRLRLTRAHDLLKLVHLDDLARRRVDEMSGGQQQRVALARALAAEPRVLLLDEPFSGLDEGLRYEMRQLVREIHQRLGTTTLLVTHDAVEALQLSDRIVYLGRGEVVQAGSPVDLYERPASADVAACFGDCTTVVGETCDGVFRCGGLDVPLGAASETAHLPNGPAIAVLRHAGVRLTSPGRLEVTESAYCGGAYLVRVWTGTCALTARAPAPRAVGERVGLHVDAGSLFVYPCSVGAASPGSNDVKPAAEVPPGTSTRGLPASAS